MMHIAALQAACNVSTDTLDADCWKRKAKRPQESL